MDSVSIVFWFLHYIWNNCYWLLISHTYSEVTHTHTHTHTHRGHTRTHRGHTHAHIRHTHTHTQTDTYCRWKMDHTACLTRIKWNQRNHHKQFNSLPDDKEIEYAGSHLSWDLLLRTPGYNEYTEIIDSKKNKKTFCNNENTVKLCSHITKFSGRFNPKSSPKFSQFLHMKDIKQTINNQPTHASGDLTRGEIAFETGSNVT